MGRAVVWFVAAGADFLWEQVDVFSGTTMSQSSGDFASCAEWGARTDDLMEDGTQIADCFPEAERDLTTLVVATVGGNDISALSQAAADGASIDDLWSETEAFVATGHAKIAEMFMAVVGE